MKDLKYNRLGCGLSECYQVYVNARTRIESICHSHSISIQMDIMAQGEAAMSNAELLAIILRNGTAQETALLLAERILDSFQWAVWSGAGQQCRFADDSRLEHGSNQPK